MKLIQDLISNLRELDNKSMVGPHNMKLWINLIDLNTAIGHELQAISADAVKCCGQRNIL